MNDDIRTAAWLAVGVVIVMASAVTHVLDTIIVPIALGVGGFLSFIAIVAAFVYGRKYFEDHPYIPYVGKHAHVLCPTCARRGHWTSSMEMKIGYAYEGWTGGGRYYRNFKRLYQVRCSNGHEWTYDPILEKNRVEKKDKVRTFKRSDATRADMIKKMRELFHVTHVEPLMYPETDEVVTAPV